jgi:hypothetical protein
MCNDDGNRESAINRWPDGVLGGFAVLNAELEPPRIGWSALLEPAPGCQGNGTGAADRGSDKLPCPARNPDLAQRHWPLTSHQLPANAENDSISDPKY